ncbi:Beta-mannosidase [Bosea sp. 62]|uniref:glycoside hydrolase family 2 protein n=1 Tax=unclassified Bosea (in: a-proteobacteria) TaxID=2653178 RepID=UPI0012569A8B|nr:MULTISPECIES: glycoside hydrolase family 2 protein [unclassified Bosea (in: a-proteobacteria)]CAD5253406.1 Beta-mannosidase [Bosea sp. 46]CAD5258161.1 Beta-mannosidase [Bosea sp. 21B]CAD5282740.1 Beta-mannosidase [Bosea sp. 7B]VVT52040.1 Beta-mannosidase [Bosea sp. EC-HK365B]VXB39963.1 Beta-mannosidase [Bosea sp. 29B]
MARIVARSGERTLPLAGWSWLATPADAATTPADLPEGGDWQEAAVPGTVAGTLRSLGRLDDISANAIGQQDHWYRTRLTEALDGRLRFEGLATVTEIWVGGIRQADSASMFAAVEIAANCPAGTEIALCFRALAPKLATAPRRSRWRPAMIQPNGLRWFRTSALGSMPGWCPPGLPTGPYRPVLRIESEMNAPQIDAVDLRTRYDRQTGTVALSLTFAANSQMPRSAIMRCAGSEAPLHSGGGSQLAGTLSLPGIVPWFPHTHGEPALHDLTLMLDGETIDLGRVGFRSLEVDRGDDGEGFGLIVNGVPVFCRGACWSNADVTTLAGGRAAYEPWLRLAREAGMNMIRLPGVMTYEDDAFFALCDELGIMVWQEMMLANFDYPQGDAGFRAAIAAEAEALLSRTQGSPSLAVLCGGSEVFQQSAMLGAPPEAWSGPVFDEILPEAVAALRPDIAYVPNSPSGGPLPFVADKGVTHYYGVGAYMRGFDDARRANVRFAAESLAFANVPEEVSLRGGKPPAITHHPDWKRAVPRDAGASWDFEDVRDHYLERLYGLEPARLRREDPERYFALSRATVAEVMEETFAEWRRPASPTSGALVWLLQDLQPGAGWGVIASDGEPKSAWHGLARAFRPVQLALTDEGVNGLGLHVLNERPEPLAATVELTCWRAGEVEVIKAKRDVALAPRAAVTLSAFELIGRFFDIAYAYRFGPPGHDVTSAVLRDAASDAVLAEAFHFPLGRGHERHHCGLIAQLEREGDDWSLALSTRRLAQSVEIVDAGWRPERSWFHLAPGEPRRIRLHRRAGATGEPSGEVRAVNALDRAGYAAGA